MQINRIQLAIIKKMAKEQNLELDVFIAKFSQQYLGRTIPTLAELSEEDADRWINTAYLESLEK